jgi:polar amino acid transport system ATP-binding protein
VGLVAGDAVTPAEHPAVEGASEPVLRAIDIWKSFGDQEVVRGITLEVRKREVVCIVGPSGSGKTTFLRCINYLEQPDRGEVWVAGERIGFRDGSQILRRRRAELELAKQRRSIGFVFQHFHLFPHMTALQNVIEAPIRVLGQRRDDAIAEGRRLLERVGLSAKEDAYPSRLSGGQQQRVAIARALAMNPVLMLFDEATSALDPEMIGEVVQVMEELAHRTTMVVVTHEMGFARRAADRVMMLDEGQVVEEAPPEEFFTAPRTERTKEFLSRILA